MGKPKKLTAEEWDACRYPGTMLPHLRTADARKLRLFVCACCRHIWDRLFDERSRKVVEAAEMWADGEITAAELKPIRPYAVKNARPGLEAEIPDGHDESGGAQFDRTDGL